jgi:hypothetical protein
MAQIEFPGPFFHRAEQALEAAPKVGGFADIGFRLRIFATQ